MRKSRYFSAWQGFSIVATGCVVAVIALPGCGGGAKPYTPSDVERAFGSAQLELNVLSDSSNGGLLTLTQEGAVPTVLGLGDSTKNMAVFVFPKTGDAKSWESAEKTAIADLKARPAVYAKQYPGSPPAKTIGIARVRNVVVVYRTTTQQLRHSISAALDNLRG